MDITKFCTFQPDIHSKDANSRYMKTNNSSKVRIPDNEAEYTFNPKINETDHNRNESVKLNQIIKQSKIIDMN